MTATTSSAGDAPGGGDPITVRIAGRATRVEPGSPLTFGRSPDCTACLDEHDLAISRHAGRIEYDGALWWVANTSASRALGFVDEFGLRSVLPPGKRRPVEGPTRVLVEGTGQTHDIALEPVERPDGGEVTVEVDDAVPETIGAAVLVNAADRLALVALFAGYLEQGPRYDPNPRSYAAAAARLGWPRTTLVKRIEYLRSRLSAAGVPNLSGWNAMNSLAEYALTTGLITRDDLDQMRRPAP